jgi:hypothetical protein
VLGAEWARLTQPARIEALTQRHLDLTDKPSVELSSLSQLPGEESPHAGRLRSATPTRSCRKTASPLPPKSQPEQTPTTSFALFHTGTMNVTKRPVAPSLSRSRIAVAAFFCATMFSLIAVRLVDVMVLGGGGSRSGYSAATAHPMRADLVDRNGVLIARDLPVSDLYAMPANFWDNR